MGKAEEVVDAFEKQFPDCKDYSGRPSIDDVERLMRPFAPISHEVQRQIDLLFHGKGLSSTDTGVHCWWEANFAVSGSGPHHQFTVDFLAHDPCTCVIPHLPAAIEHSTGDVDARLIALRDAWNNCGRDELAFHRLISKSRDS